jgi:hypothetical protein
MQSDPASAHDELVEKIAREIYSQEYDPEHYPFERLEECEKVLCRKQARAALAVARPVIREECARVAEGVTSYAFVVQKSAGCYTTGQRIAAKIRAME